MVALASSPAAKRASNNLGRQRPRDKDQIRSNENAMGLTLMTLTSSNTLAQGQSKRESDIQLEGVNHICGKENSCRAAAWVLISTLSRTAHAPAPAPMPMFSSITSSPCKHVINYQHL